MGTVFRIGFSFILLFWRTVEKMDSYIYSSLDSSPNFKTLAKFEKLMFEIEYFESEIKQSQASPLAKCFQDEMNAVTQRAKTAQKYLLDMYCALSSPASSETSTTPSVSLQSASSSVVSMSISTRSSPPTFSDLGPTDKELETDSME